MKLTLFSAAILGTATAISLPNPPEHYASPDIKKRACSQAEVALATGIHLNINGQYSEYNGTVKVDQVEASKGSAAEFNNAKGQLVRDPKERLKSSIRADFLSSNPTFKVG